MKKYKLRLGWYFEISEVEIIRETDASVFFIGSLGKTYSERKDASNHSYFNTFEEAKQRAIEIVEGRIQVKQIQLEIEIEKLKKAKELTPKSK